MSTLLSPAGRAWLDLDCATVCMVGGRGVAAWRARGAPASPPSSAGPCLPAVGSASLLLACALPARFTAVVVRARACSWWACERGH